SAQIERMSSTIRSLVGKRPRGMTLAGNIWDYSLVTSLDSCSMEYLLLDATLVPSSSRCFYPLITGGLGKSIKVLCVHSELAPDFPSGESPEAWISRIQKTVLRAVKGDESPLVMVSLDLPLFRQFFSSAFFAYAAGYFEDPDGEAYRGIRFTLPQTYLKGAKVFIPGYIPAGMDWTLARWARKAFEACENRSRFPLTVYDYLNCYKSSGCLYDRMMYISMVLAQGHGGDKIQKKLAKEKLWEAQGIENYVPLPSGLPASSERRQEAFRLLNEAELIIRQEGTQRASIVSYDYNRDGLGEYVCSMRNLRLVITRLAAQIVELDNISKGCNYASSLSRIAAFDGKDDGYNRGFFTDHFFASGAIDGYSISLDAGTDVFSKILFDEKKLDSRRNEILLSSRVCLPGSSAPVELLKKYTVLDDGLSIQYILRNDGDEPLLGTFVVESNFAQTCFSKKAGFQYSCELVLDGETRVLDTQSPFRSDGHVSALRITDLHDKMQFNFEPNEEAGFIADTIVFRRPDAYNSISEDSRTLVTSFFWNVDLPSGMSVEKNINFSVTSVRSRKKNSSPSL
ncbi:MAG: DUF1926 domain-containing protein, partial [Treponema sp.]|nr:DUF1926 domain-containing protein [Treponema sp.]